MGFQVPRKTARLQFEGDEFDNCEIVVALDLSLGASDHMAELQKADSPKEMIGFFADNCIDSWNLEDADGKPLPVIAETFFQLPAWFSLLMINGWAAAVKKASEVAPPLDEPSKNGDSSAEPPETMEALSSVRENSPTRNS